MTATKNKKVFENLPTIITVGSSSRGPIYECTCTRKLAHTAYVPEVRMHIHTDARTRQMYVHMSYTRAVGVSNTVIKGDGNSRPVGSKRRDREDVVDVAVP